MVRVSFQNSPQRFVYISVRGIDDLFHEALTPLPRRFVAR